jgi:hypothetical protein
MTQFTLDVLSVLLLVAQLAIVLAYLFFTSGWYGNNK